MTEDASASVPTFTASGDDAGQRLDVFLAARFPEHSRTWLARQVDEGRVEVRGSRARKVRPGLRIEAGDVVRANLPLREEPRAAPEKIPLRVIYEDEWLAVIDKPPGLTVHPGSGEKSGTLANALAWRFGELSGVQGPTRPGIVHRLDKDTSGVILVAKDDTSHWNLAGQFRDRTVRKEYLAVVRGRVELDADLISAPLGPDRHRPTRVAVRMDVGRPSETYFEVIERFEAQTYVRCLPKTGRTHQIRVHMASIGHPIVSDPLYGGSLPSLAPFCPRQALHAHSLTIRHPHTADVHTFVSPLPADVEALLSHLRGA